MSKKGTQLVLRVEALDRDLKGVEMGVAPDGSAFLSQRGVADLCGVVPSVITMFAQEVVRGDRTPRAETLREILATLKWTGPLFTEIPTAGGTVNAYSDVVVVAFLQYYAFHSRSPSARAAQALALLATKTLREMIYAALGLAPVALDQSWNALHERMLMNEVPAGYFSVFSASAPILVAAKRAGLDIGPHTVPDISIGRMWSTWWVEKKLDVQFGPRRSWPHRYPHNHPQAVANGYIEANIYPLAALGVFSVWMEEHYLPSQFPKYLKTKVKEKAIGAEEAMKLQQAVLPKQLKPGS